MLDDAAMSPNAYVLANWTCRSDAEIAADLSVMLGRRVTRNTIKCKRRELGLVKDERGVPLIFSEQPYTRFDDPPVIEADSACVLADVHSPFYDAAWCSNVVHQARLKKIPILLIAGDLFDMKTLSPFVPKTSGDFAKVPTLSEELDSTAEFCETAQREFERVFVILGNHEERVTRRLGTEQRIGLIRHLLGVRKSKKFVVSPYHYAIIKSSDGQQWRVTHPKNASVIPVRVAANLTLKFEQNVVAAHGHDWGETTSASGRYACASGMCCDARYFDYVCLEDNTRPLMQQGAWLLCERKPALLHPVWRPSLAE